MLHVDVAGVEHEAGAVVGGVEIIPPIADNLLKRGSASSAEWNWPEFDFIWTKKRNRLKAAKVTMLVHVHSNLHLIGKRSRSQFDDANTELCAHEDEDGDSPDEEGASA